MGILGSVIKPLSTTKWRAKGDHWLRQGHKENGRVKPVCAPPLKGPNLPNSAICNDGGMLQGKYRNVAARGTVKADRGAIPLRLKGTAILTSGRRMPLLDGFSDLNFSIGQVR